MIAEVRSSFDKPWIANNGDKQSRGATARRMSQQASAILLKEVGNSDVVLFPLQLEHVA